MVIAGLWGLLILYYVCSVMSGVLYVIVMGPLKGNKITNTLGDFMFVLFMVPFVANPMFIYGFVKKVWKDL